MNPENIIEIRNLTFIYEDGTKALDHLDFNLPAGKITALLGANGAGKSSLMMVLNGLLKPQHGDYRICFEKEKNQRLGQESSENLVIYSRQQLRILRQKVGVVFQEPDTQLFSENVSSEITFGMRNQNKSKDEIASSLQQVLEEMDLQTLKDKPTHALSYGQKKRVCIADILVMKPKVMVLDEPTAGLDPIHHEKMLALLIQLKAQEMTVLVSTHDVDSVWQFADHVVILNNGKVVAEGVPESVFESEALLKHSGLRMPYMMQLLMHVKKPWREIWESRPKTIPAIMEEIK